MSLRYKGENDSIIYKVAYEQVGRHEDAIAGRVTASKSPYIRLADDAVCTQRELLLEADCGGRSRSGTPP
jgi:hypothetical protein